MSLVPRMAVVVVVLVAALGQLGCGRAHLFYDARELRHPAFEATQEAALAATLAEKLAGRTLIWVDADGRERTIVIDGAASLKPLGPAELGALWLVTAVGERGGENDLRVKVGRGPPQPVSVLTDLEGNVRLVTGTRAKPDEAALSEVEIQQRFDLDGGLPGRWEDTERRALTRALSTLSPAELATVQRVHFDREKAPRTAGSDQAALYEQRGCPASIFVFSSAVRSDRYRFIGEPDAPDSAVVHAIVHEIGHAFEKAPSRQRACASLEEKAGSAALSPRRSPEGRVGKLPHQKEDSLKANGAKKNALVQEANALADDNPILRAYLKALDGLPAPTDYGTTSPSESFAESFALFHVDPDALRRTRPKVFAWFKAGGHEQALREASLPGSSPPRS